MMRCSCREEITGIVCRFFVSSVPFFISYKKKACGETNREFFLRDSLAVCVGERIREQWNFHDEKMYRNHPRNVERASTGEPGGR
jgi:hypothetical protein